MQKFIANDLHRYVLKNMYMDHVNWNIDYLQNFFDMDITYSVHGMYKVMTCVAAW